MPKSMKDRFDYGQNPNKMQGGELISSYEYDYNRTQVAQKQGPAIFQALLSRCDFVKGICETYMLSCFVIRNRYLVDRPQRVIAVYDRRNHGGTLFTMRYARISRKELHIIRI